MARIASHGPFDVIIDDGSHVPSHQKLTFQTLWPHLRPGGLYAVEDIETSFWAETKLLYGYKLTREASILNFFGQKVVDEVNAEFSRGKDATDILSIQFYRNLVLIAKRPLHYGSGRAYRWKKNLNRLLQPPPPPPPGSPPIPSRRQHHHAKRLHGDHARSP